MIETSGTPAQLGFLTVLRDGGCYFGGYLVTNFWGRPLEFRLSTAVQPNKVQQILYGNTLDAYISGELIGKTLVEKTATPVQIVLTDCTDVLQLRRVVDVPVALIGDSQQMLGEQRVAAVVPIVESRRKPLVTHPDYEADAPRINELIERLAGLDVAEPFARIREAFAEARKMGVTHRAA